MRLFLPALALGAVLADCSALVVSGRECSFSSAAGGLAAECFGHGGVVPPQHAVGLGPSTWPLGGLDAAMAAAAGATSGVVTVGAISCVPRARAC